MLFLLFLAAVLDIIYKNLAQQQAFHSKSHGAAVEKLYGLPLRNPPFKEPPF